MRRCLTRKNVPRAADVVLLALVALATPRSVAASPARVSQKYAAYFDAASARDAIVAERFAWPNVAAFTRALHPKRATYGVLVADIAEFTDDVDVAAGDAALIATTRARFAQPKTPRTEREKTADGVRTTIHFETDDPKRSVIAFSTATNEAWVEAGVTVLAERLLADSVRTLARETVPYVLRGDGVAIAVIPVDIIPAKVGAPPDVAAFPYAYVETLSKVSRPLYVKAEVTRPSELFVSEFEPRVFRQSRETRKRRDPFASLRAAFASGDERESLRGIEALLARKPRQSARILGEAATWASANGHPQHAVELRRHFRPVGRCSMDTAPIFAARAYADACYAVGDLGCTVVLMQRIIGDRFDRVAYSSMASAQNRTQAERLVSMGIEPARFLSGLTYRFADRSVRSEYVSVWRIGRAAVEAGLGQAFADALRSAAGDTALDEYNRLRAFQVLATFAWYQPTVLDDDTRDAQGARSRDANVQRVAGFRERISNMTLTPSMQAWLDDNGML